MSETLLTVLTDANARTADAVTTSLDNEYSAGAPWYDVAGE